MTDIQEKILQLLDEIDEICHENNIKYFLHKHIAYDAYKYNKITEDYIDAQIIMDVENALKFKEVFEKNKKKNRELECLDNNSSFPGFYLKYTDLNTLYYDLYSCNSYNYNGICVYIDIIKYDKKNVITKQVSRLLEIGSLVNNMNIYDISSKKKIFAGKFYRFYKGYLSTDKKAKKVFKYLCKNYSKNHSEYCYIMPDSIYNAQNKKYKCNIFDDTQRVELEGHYYDIPKKAKDYFKAQYGKCWEDYDHSGKKEDSSKVVSAVIPCSVYEEKLKNIQITNVSIEKFLQFRLTHVREDSQISKKRKEIDNYWSIVERTGDRFYFYKNLVPKKDYLIQLSINKEYDKLKIELEDLLERMVYFSEIDLVLAFDKDIFDIAIKLLDNGTYRQKKCADYIKENVKQDMFNFHPQLKK